MNQIHSSHWNVLTAIGRRWQQWRDRQARMSELNLCAQEIDRIASDVGMSVAELRRVVSNGPDAASELHGRLAALSLDKLASADWLLMRDLERVCSQCDVKRRCRSDLEKGSISIQDAYCPNRATLVALAQESPGQRN